MSPIRSLISDPVFKDEFDRRITPINLQRAMYFSLLLLFINSILIYYDYNNYINGFWDVNVGYRYLFYTHVTVFGAALLTYFVGLLIGENANSLAVESIIFWSRAIVIFFVVSLLFTCALISGAVDQLIHSQITVYLLGVFTVSSVFYFRPVSNLLLLGGSWAVFIICLQKFQPSPEVLRANFGNGTIMVFLALFFAVSIHNLRFKDLLHEWNLGKQIQEETGKRIQEQEKAFRLAAIVESSNDGIVGMTKEGIVNYWNKSAERIYGYTEEDVLGKRLCKVLGEEYHEEIVDEIKRTLLGSEEITNYETKRRHKCGQVLDVSITSSAIKDYSGDVIGISIIVRDLSDIKRIEREISRLDSLNVVGEMAASISHEVRNPMTTVKGYLQLLSMKEETEKIRPYFDMMIEELDRANSILTEFLSISKTKVTEKSRQNLNSIIDTMLPLLRANAIQKNQSIKTDLREIPDLMLNNKETRQVVLNIAKNGIEAMDEGKMLTIRTYLTGDEVSLEIQDQGRGIRPEVIGKLGTPFFTTKDSGTGLGLAVCNSIIERHGARMEIESSEVGTVFSVRFKVE